MASNLRVDSIVPATGTNVAIGTAGGGVNIPGVLTYEDVTNVDSVGVVTARSGVNVVGNDLNVGSNIKIGNASGIVTATSFSGSGANLTSLPAANLTGTLPAISGANLTGIGTANPSQAHGFAFMDSQYFTTSATKMNFNNSNSGDISSGVTIDRTNERLTPTVAGTYLVQTQLMFSYSTGGSNIQFVVFQYKNGSEYAYNTQDQYRGSGLVSNVICQSLMTFNGSSDYVEMWAKHNGGGNAIMGVASTFMIVRIA